MDIGLSPGDFVLGTQYPLPKMGAEPPSPPKKILADVYCGKMAGWIKMPLGMKVGLSPVDFVLHGDPAPFPKRRRSP